MFRTNFVTPFPAPAMPGHPLHAGVFARAVDALKLTDDPNYGMTEKTLSAEDNDKIIQIVAGLGVKNINKNDLRFFHSAPSDAYFQKLLQDGDEGDRDFVDRYSRGLFRGGSTHINSFDKRLMSFIPPSDVEEIGPDCGVDKDVILRNWVAHEFAHKAIPTLILPGRVYDKYEDVLKARKLMMENELVADHVASELAGAESSFLYSCYKLKFSIYGMESDYTLACNVVKDAFDEVIGVISGNLAADIRNKKIYDPFSMLLDKLGSADFVTDKTNVKKIFSEIMDEFFDKYVRGREYAPIVAADFRKRIINQYQAILKARAEAIMRRRLTG